MSRYGYQDNFFNSIPVGTRSLLIANIAVYILFLIEPLGTYIGYYFVLYPVDTYLRAMLGKTSPFIHKISWLWQTTTYMFLHAKTGSFAILHIFFNMFILYQLGRVFEASWGTKTFLKFYFFCGTSAGFFILFTQLIGLGGSGGLTLGASGAIFGLMLAYGLSYPEREVLFIIFPMKIKYFLIGIFIFSFLGLILPGLVPFISHAGHLGGMLAAILFFRLNKNSYHFRPLNQSLNSFFRAIFKSLGLRSLGDGRRSKPTVGFKRLFDFKKEKDVRYMENLDELKMTDREIENKIDELLDKISEEGLRGLSVEEQLFLDRVSSLYRHKFPD